MLSDILILIYRILANIYMRRWWRHTKNYKGTYIKSITLIIMFMTQLTVTVVNPFCRKGWKIADETLFQPYPTAATLGNPLLSSHTPLY